MATRHQISKGAARDCGLCSHAMAGHVAIPTVMKGIIINLLSMDIILRGSQGPVCLPCAAKPAKAKPVIEEVVELVLNDAHGIIPIELTTAEHSIENLPDAQIGIFLIVHDTVRIANPSRTDLLSPAEINAEGEITALQGNSDPDTRTKASWELATQRHLGHADEIASDIMGIVGSAIDDLNSVIRGLMSAKEEAGLIDGATHSASISIQYR